MNPVDMSFLICYTVLVPARQTGLYGEMSEWFMELVLKTSDTERCRGFESLSLRHFNVQYGEVPKLAEGAPLLRA
jgi:hypothetical protein